MTIGIDDRHFQARGDNLMPADIAEAGPADTGGTSKEMTPVERPDSDGYPNATGGVEVPGPKLIVNVAGGVWGRVKNRTEAGGGCQPLDGDNGIPTAQDRVGDPEPGNAMGVPARTSGT